MNVEELLCTEIKKYNNIIIYGYRDIGTCVLDYLEFLATDIKLSNYAGKVKYFATTNHVDQNHEKKGIPIRWIEDLTEYCNSALVIVSTQEQYHPEIGETLKKLGFRNIIYISYEMYILLKEHVENYNRQLDNQIRQYSLMHEIRLDRLRAKAKNGAKVKVFFMTQRAAAFGCGSVYRAMEKSDLFEPYVLCISKRDIWHDDFYADVVEDINFFEKRGFRAINAYDENKNPKDIVELNPDIIFWDSPNLYGPARNSHFRLDQINWKFLTCYIPYGLLMVDSFYYHFNNLNVREAWKFFLDTAASFNRSMYEAEFNGLNIVKAGYPKFDDLDNDYVLPDKLNNDKKLVIYAPHWTLDIENNFATFDLYKDYIFGLAKKNPDIMFVFKPHPELGFRIKALYTCGRSEFSFEDYEKYMEDWNNLPNGMCITQGDYMGLFERSDCMITDCGSFIGEYLPSQNPCIYLFNPRKERQMDSYTPLAKKILNTYYVTHTMEELEENWGKVVINGNDAKRDDRKKVLESEFGEIGKAGEYICDYLRRQIVDY
ncbi:MAG: CDP-glycerol glycerophosphotransferase family protein [Butyrivibrio sp.]|nr:CDP-glycerol glycerophosphotransferase family protein [Butyrivibrio sp.]